MSSSIDFYFDFSSPYGYLASEKIEAMAARHGRSVDWRPVLLGVMFKATGMAPLTEIPLKGDYSRRDLARSARFHDCWRSKTWTWGIARPTATTSPLASRWRGVGSSSAVNSPRYLNTS